MPKNKSSPGEKADFFAFPSRFTILGQVRKNTIPIYLPTKRPRIGTIMKNHIQSSSGLSKAALFVCSESDTSLKNCITLSSFVNFYLNFSKRDVVFDIPFTLNMICYILFSKSSADNFNRCAKASCHS